jgi:DNA-binding GntR family transcriptional regulator
MPHIQRVVLSDQVKDFIVGAILDGELLPGDRVVESALARELGMSQAPVRDAIRELVMMGFLDTEPHKGTSVRSFTPDEQYEVYVVRAALESLAARLACTRLTEEDEAELEGLLEGMIEAGQRGDLNGMTRLDNQFHERIMELAGNNLLHQLWKRLEFGYWTIATARSDTWDLKYLAGRHRQLLQALKAHKPELAAETMRCHIEDLGRPPEQPSEVYASMVGQPNEGATD